VKVSGVGSAVSSALTPLSFAHTRAWRNAARQDELACRPPHRRQRPPSTVARLSPVNRRQPSSRAFLLCACGRRNHRGRCQVRGRWKGQQVGRPPAAATQRGRAYRPGEGEYGCVVSRVDMRLFAAVQAVVRRQQQMATSLLQARYPVAENRRQVCARYILYAPARAAAHAVDTARQQQRVRVLSPLCW